MPKTYAPTKKTDATNATTAKQDPDKPAKPGGDLGKDAFLKLLVAQLKYQDPSKPMDNSEFLAQTAQFTTVEKLEDLATAEQSMLNAQLQLGASNLIGKTVTYADKDGHPITGVVSSAKFFTGGPPTLHVGNTDIALASVTEVSDGQTPPATQNPQPAPPGAQTTQPSAQTTQPGTHDTPPAAQNTQPSAQNTQPGAHDTPPTAQNTQPSAQNTQPSAQNTQPAVQNGQPAQSGAQQQQPQQQQQQQQQPAGTNPSAPARPAPGQPAS
ncbi:flagellar hook capping FlgD N-terminal domain-containing protein [Dactylosporangium sp. CA-139114]|uniref:flagellar hook capping FlgD N-terminal domain-containing protein n=1 Tax=Dactylosporangium sp. CA-139114 TaxID=3239931 RepID=UPI003D999F5D